MPHRELKAHVCQVCKLEKPHDELLPAELVRDPLVELIRAKIPDWSVDGFICLEDLNAFRAEYIRKALETDRGELSALDEQVIKSLHEQDLLSRDINTDFTKKFTFGERLADKIAVFGGSWRFISIFAAVILIWISFNTAALLRKPFDPFPYILLNLVLSCLAAIQAPIIMMSQNRQESKDRLRNEYDYRINLKAELEIRHLQEKLDHYLSHQWQRLLEIQQIQMELMEELTQQNNKTKPPI
ncbi:MAG: DUF1003 domain-containing protein [bacterium]|nr:DUF1003 domain-containing protein [bacterium]